MGRAPEQAAVGTADGGVELLAEVIAGAVEGEEPGEEQKETRRAAEGALQDPGHRREARGRAEADPRYHGHAESALAPWLALTRWRLRRAGIQHNDAMYGLGSTGATDEAALLSAIGRLSPGLNEIYLHPATRRGLTATMAGYRHDDELAALLSPRVRTAIEARGIVTGRWVDFVRC